MYTSKTKTNDGRRLDEHFCIQHTEQQEDGGWRISGSKRISENILVACKKVNKESITAGKEEKWGKGWG